MSIKNKYFLFYFTGNRKIILILVSSAVVLALIGMSIGLPLSLKSWTHEGNIFGLGLATLLSMSTYLRITSKVEKSYKFKLWCISSCVVGEYVVKCERRCVTSVLKKKLKSICNMLLRLLLVKC